MLRLIRKTIFALGLTLLTVNNCFAGDRELAVCEQIPGFPDAICYTKIHMDSIKMYRNLNGQRIISYLKEVHTLNTVNNKHIANLLSVEIDADKAIQKTTSIKLVNYETGQTTYDNFSFGWFAIQKISPEQDYVLSNYERYISRGTIGDNFRPYDEMLTEERNLK